MLHLTARLFLKRSEGQLMLRKQERGFELRAVARASNDTQSSHLVVSSNFPMLLGRKCLLKHQISPFINTSCQFQPRRLNRRLKPADVLFLLPS